MYSSSQGCHTATGTHMPHGITQCYLPPGRGDIPALEDRTCSSQDMVATDKYTHTHKHGHTDRQTDTLITILRSPVGSGITVGRILCFAWLCGLTVTDRSQQTANGGLSNLLTASRKAVVDIHLVRNSEHQRFLPARRCGIERYCCRDVKFHKIFLAKKFPKIFARNFRWIFISAEHRAAWHAVRNVTKCYSTIIQLGKLLMKILKTEP